jgi:hypothetical protein
MEDDHVPAADKPTRRSPWNKAKLVGAKPPCDRVMSGRSEPSCRSRAANATLALFNLAIDSKLHGCDVVAVRVDDVAPSGYAMNRARDHSPEEDRQASAVRTDGPNAVGDRRVPEADWPKAGSVSVRWSRRRLAWADHRAACAASVRVDRQHWSRPGQVRHALAAPDECDADLPADWESKSGASSRHAQATLRPSCPDQRFRPRDGAGLPGVTPSNFGVTSAIILRTSSPHATRS